ncbi:MAG: hypothetical protein JJ839_007445 [Prochlorococcus marinus CUG1430]|uniref:hypothetical protein n=2 Tax=Prochlorococcus marinus TaxID=1219 RepID=UPI00214CC80C|nr:hypothetical protein [Prochlorococcus marinus]MCR8538314.1 hypothetical protein [Prochlorococcus marinus CUG1430]
MLNTIQNAELFLIKLKKKLMQENFKNHEFCIKEALDNAKKRINLLDNSNKKCVLEEYKEWINDGLSNHKVLLLREDPII